MKEKITMSVVFALFIGIVWIGSNPKSITSENVKIVTINLPALYNSSFTNLSVLK